MSPPTARQLEVLRAMSDFIATNGYPPTVRELCEIFGFRSTITVNNPGGKGHLQCLERKGCLHHVELGGKARSWRITDRGRRLLGHRPSATGTVDLGSRCPDCNAQLFGGLTHCAEHRSAA